MSKLGKKMIAAAEEGGEIARGSSDPCPACGLNRAIVGKAHNCRPRPQVTTNTTEVTTNTKGDNKSVDSKPIICHPEAIVVTQQEIDSAFTVTHQRRGRGRPKITGPRPWDTEGISRKTWYKRRAKI
jgi:hypothetical protein